MANTPPNASPSQVNLDLIKAPEVVRNKPDKLSKEELELEEKELLNTELAQNIKARKRYASAVFILVISWVTPGLCAAHFPGIRLSRFSFVGQCVARCHRLNHGGHHRHPAHRDQVPLSREILKAR